MHKPKIIFFGNERLATSVATDTPVLLGLINNGYRVGAVITSYQPAKSRRSRELEIATVAKKHGIPLLMPKSLSSIKETLAAYKAQAGVLVAYGQIISEEIIDIFPSGIINIHPSLLPQGRGPTPIEQAILEGAKTTGVSLMRLTKEMDSGPVFAQKSIELTDKLSKQELADKLLNIGSELLLAKLPLILTDKAEAMPQNDSEANYSQLLSKQDGQINWNKPAKKIEREIRAFLGWPGSYTESSAGQLTITKAHAVESLPSVSSVPIGKAFQTMSKELAFACSEGFLIVDKLKPAGKKEMTGQEFLAGYGNRL